MFICVFIYRYRYMIKNKAPVKAKESCVDSYYSTFSMSFFP